MENKMFEIATRKKLRFNFKGLKSVEELWDLSLTDLDSIFKGLNSEFKKSQEESFLETKSEEDKLVELKIQIIKYIVNVKKEEKAAKQNAKENAAKKQQILAILNQKEAEDLQNKTPEELKKMLQEL